MVGDPEDPGSTGVPVSVRPRLVPTRVSCDAHGPSRHHRSTPCRVSSTSRLGLSAVEGRTPLRTKGLGKTRPHLLVSSGPRPSVGPYTLLESPVLGLELFGEASGVPPGPSRCKGPFP